MINPNHFSTGSTQADIENYLKYNVPEQITDLILNHDLSQDPLSLERFNLFESGNIATEAGNRFHTDTTIDQVVKLIKPASMEQALLGNDISVIREGIDAYLSNFEEMPKSSKPSNEPSQFHAFTKVKKLVSQMIGYKEEKTTAKDNCHSFLDELENIQSYTLKGHNFDAAVKSLNEAIEYMKFDNLNSQELEASELDNINLEQTLHYHRSNTLIYQANSLLDRQVESNETNMFALNEVVKLTNDAKDYINTNFTNSSKEHDKLKANVNYLWKSVNKIMATNPDINEEYQKQAESNLSQKPFDDHETSYIESNRNDLLRKYIFDVPEN